jgi:hypothetical protein
MYSKYIFTNIYELFLFRKTKSKKIHDSYHILAPVKSTVWMEGAEEGSRVGFGLLIVLSIYQVYTIKFIGNVIFKLLFGKLFFGKNIYETVENSNFFKARYISSEIKH